MKMTFDQVIKNLQGTLKINETKKQEAIARFKKEYPYGKITETGTSIGVRVDSERHCMKCGTKMIDRINQTVKGGAWVPLKRKNNISNWECPACNPLKGFEPIGITSSEHLE
jgi:predicted RNA-binding Zn-ribbon protein involved in translation (DUF1610 family)